MRRVRQKTKQVNFGEDVADDGREGALVPGKEAKRSQESTGGLEKRVAMLEERTAASLQRMELLLSSLHSAVLGSREAQ